MNNHKIEAMIEKLKQPAGKALADILKDVSEGRPPTYEESSQRIANAMTPELLKMNSGETCELLGIFIAELNLKAVAAVIEKFGGVPGGLMDEIRNSAKQDNDQTS